MYGSNPAMMGYNPYFNQGMIVPQQGMMQGMMPGQMSMMNSPQQHMMNNNQAMMMQMQQAQAQSGVQHSSDKSSAPKQDD